MDESVPEGAAKLLDLIGDTEAPRGYDTLYGNNDEGMEPKLTAMTLSQVIAAGPSWSSEFGSSACGRYQFINKTLKGLKKSEDIPGKAKFSPDLQDRLAYVLLDNRGYEKFISGKMSITKFGLALAKEWASFPVLEDCQGAHRWVKRGETYYAGDELNKALVKPSTVEKLLAQILKTAARVEHLSGADASKIADLIALGSSEEEIRKVQKKAKKIMKGIYGYETLKNACAATLSTFLRDAGIDVPVTTGAGRLARRLRQDRRWERIENGHQRPGDVGVTFDKKPPDGADHIYLVVYRYNADKMLIADNQAPFPHERFVSGKGKTATEYFLRAPGDARGIWIYASDFVAELSEYPTEDEDTNDLPDPQPEEEGKRATI